MARRLREIAAEIRANWNPIHPMAKQYVDAMAELDALEDRYGGDTGMHAVSYFLGVSSTWKGPVARRIKRELAEMAGIKVRR